MADLMFAVAGLQRVDLLKPIWNPFLMPFRIYVANTGSGCPSNSLHHASHCRGEETKWSHGGIVAPIVPDLCSNSRRCRLYGYVEMPVGGDQSDLSGRAPFPMGLLLLDYYLY